MHCSVFGWPDSNIVGMRKLKKRKLWANVFQAFPKFEQYLEVDQSVQTWKSLALCVIK